MSQWWENKGTNDIDSVTPRFFFILQSKQLILKHSISALKDLNVEFLLDFVQKRICKTCYKEYILY